MVSPVNVTIILVISLAGLGLYGLLISRNMIRLVLCLQIMIKAAMLGLLLAGHLAGKTEVGQSLAITVIVADTVIAVVALALAVRVRRVMGTLDVRELSRLKK